MRHAARVALAAAALLTAGVAAHRCGLMDAEIAAEAAKPVPVVPQEYTARRPDDELRRLQVSQQSYDAQTFTQNLTDVAQPIRIVALWGVLNAGDRDTNGVQRQCVCTTADPADRCGGRSTSAVVAPSSGSVEVPAVCKPNMVVSMQAGAGANARRRVLEMRTNDAIARWNRTLSVRPVLDPITVSAGTARAFGLTGPLPMPNADLVLIMTARPSPNKPIAGYAVCKQKDQLGRCTVGHFNWVPELFKPAKADDPATAGSEMHTALHEIAHLFGAILPGSTQADTPFIWPDGTKKIPVQHKVIKKARDPAFGTPAKMMTWVTTPRVVAVARKYIDCPTIDGVPLEDVPLGAGAHWDARFLGPEFMSYGTCECFGGGGWSGACTEGVVRVCQL